MISRPLLAAKTTDADLEKLRFPMLASPKIDGVRALVVGGKLLSRSMKPIPNKHVQDIFGRKEFEGLDGELVCGNPFDKNLMQQTTSGVMSHNGTPRVEYHVFDKWDSGDRLAFIDRWNSLELYTRHDVDCLIKQVPHTYVYSLDDILALEKHYVNQGYEGIMLRDPHGRYKQNRSTLREGILLKVKRFHDGEATVTGYEALERNLNGATLDERGYTKRSTAAEGRVADELIGSLTVRDLASGVQFSIGSGFTESQRRDLWEDRENLLGKIVKYKSFAVGVKDKPRFPIFLGFRSLLDM